MVGLYLRASQVLFVLFALSIGSDHAAYGFVRNFTSAGTPTSWFTQCIPIWLNDQENLPLSQNAVIADLQKALAEWEGVDCTNLSFAYQGLIPQDAIGFDSNPEAINHNIVTFVQTQSNWLTDPLAVALTTVTSCQNETMICAEGTIIDADIEINEAYYVFTASSAIPSDRRMDLLSILTHELGHLIGLDHPPNPDATMYMSSIEGEIKKRDLTLDDELGVCDAFPLDDTRQCLLESYDLQNGLPIVTPENQRTVDQGCTQIHSKEQALLLYLLLCSLFIKAFGTNGQQTEEVT